MYAEESGVKTSPRPAPVCSASDLAMPSLTVLGACVLSMSCATRVEPEQSKVANAMPTVAMLCEGLRFWMMGFCFIDFYAVQVGPLSAQGSERFNFHTRCWFAPGYERGRIKR